ncbi:helix-turn-helix domain-containing protein [Flammeovirga aprica]|uniref:Helix-turn-helix transcriptional regulator n=1 Tax=Flammeovirga aprica JL-4 TaxID=694437 RepID=A0A7X9RSL1_9BACT|nr:helix-turn-helix transcriptional regulator [Flammeovirga aprica]NME67216.1 helix-turn-helix transcriptional regulator [Flammeovirga aprica JL-4]
MFNKINHQGKRLSLYLHDRSISQHEAADIIGVHRSSIQRYLSAETWTEKQMDTICHGLGVDKEIFEIEENTASSSEEAEYWRNKYYDSLEKLNQLYEKIDSKNDENNELKKKLEKILNSRKDK